MYWSIRNSKGDHIDSIVWTDSVDVDLDLFTASECIMI